MILRTRILEKTCIFRQFKEPFAQDDPRHPCYRRLRSRHTFQLQHLKMIKSVITRVRFDNDGPPRFSYYTC